MFDDLEESTLISAEVHHNFLHQFLDIGSNVLYPIYVSIPLTQEELENHTREFALAGFHGCIGSTDATHVAIEKCSYRLWNNHLGSKQHLTTRTFNLTVNHRHQILSTTIGMPGRWNDKTVVLFDEFVSGIYEGKYRIMYIFYPLECTLINFYAFFFMKGTIHSDLSGLLQSLLIKLQLKGGGVTGWSHFERMWNVHLVF
jgi:hypothetical protein